MIIKIKKLHSDAVIPTYAKDGDAGLDFTTIDSGTWEPQHEYISYKTGLALEIPKGYVGLLFPRSSISNRNVCLANAVGVVDSGYRGEITFRFKYLDRHRDKDYRKGDKIGQLIILPFPQITIVEALHLSDSERGTSGFGSTTPDGAA